MTANNEFALIQRFFAAAKLNSCVQKGIGDDAAILKIASDKRIVISSDTLIQGRHFPDATSSYDIAWKSLAVNLSDVAAMGAKPIAFTLALTLPEPDEKFLQEFSRGLFALADQYDVSLIGGDTTKGHLSITITALGELPLTQSLLRSSAQVGDDIYLSGTVGAAAFALQNIIFSSSAEKLNQAEKDASCLRLNRPEPRVLLGQELLSVAHSCIDVSDGVLQDLGHILQQSSYGAEVYLENMPIDNVLRFCSQEEQWRYALNGGDDYELLFTAPPSARSAIAELHTPCTRIGTIIAEKKLLLRHHDNVITWPKQGFQHF